MNLAKKTKFVIFWVAVAAAFVASSSYLIILAAGYRLNLEKRRLQKTALIVIKSIPRDAVVYINGKVIAEKTPIRKSSLLPGLYEVKIEKPGHQAWQRSLNLDEGLAYDLTNVILFLKDPQVEAAADQNPSLPKFENDPDLFFSNGEIWFKDRLVTRLSSDIKNAVVHPGRGHIAFQVDGEIRILEISGTNNALLVKLGSSEKADFGFQDNDTLIFIDDGKVKKAKIF